MGMNQKYNDILDSTDKLRNSKIFNFQILSYNER